MHIACIVKKQEKKRDSSMIKSWFLNLYKRLGPGLVTGSSDDDPSGIATYSQAGAQFGFATLWTSVLTFPLMSNIQGMCARIGLVTAEGLTGTLRKHYSRPVLIVMLMLSIPAIIFNIGANISAVGAVGNMLTPRIDPSFYSVLFTIILLIGMVYFSYEKIARILKYLCLSLLLYIAVPFLIDINIKDIIHSIINPYFSFDKEFIGILVAIFGTTISPYLFYWQTTMMAEDIKLQKKKLIVNRKIISEVENEVDFGMFFSNLVMFFIILTTGSVLHNAGIRDIQTVDQAAAALQPLAGESAHILFSLGIIGTGFLSIPVLSGSLSYMLCETFGWTEGLSKRFSEAKSFYMVIALSLLIGLSLNYIGIPPFQALIYAATLYGITAPVLIGIIMHISNNKSIMGEFTNSRLSNFGGILTMLVMSASAVFLLLLELGWL